MICLDEKVLSDLYGLRETLLRVRNEGLEERFDMRHYKSDCGTTHCAAGWHAVFNPSEFSTVSTASMFSNSLPAALFGLSYVDPNGPSAKAMFVLFGHDRGFGLTPHDSLTRQIAATNWFIHRIEALKEYERIRALPRRERRRLGVAA